MFDLCICSDNYSLTNLENKAFLIFVGEVRLVHSVWHILFDVGWLSSEDIEVVWVGALVPATLDGRVIESARVPGCVS